jgi:predicted Fe-Mo cluster-binding NifX family protein
MKLLITTTSPEINADLDARFGRGAFFLTVDSDTLAWHALPNPALNARGGAGVKAAQFITDQKYDAVISGAFGPNAYNALKTAGIPMYLFGSCQSVQEVLQRFQSGEIERLDASTGTV